jgi:hypothetical protein
MAFNVNGYAHAALYNMKEHESREITMNQETAVDRYVEAVTGIHTTAST